MDSVKCYSIKDGIHLYHIPVDKFKTLSISINIHRPLCREEASCNALLTDVLARGSRAYPDNAALERALQDLYGAQFDTDVRKKGEDQILTFGLGVLSDRYAPGDAELSLAATRLLLEMVLNPLLEGDGFRADYVAQEKVNLINDIEAIINDKREYATLRLLQLMCEGEPYAVHELGTVEDVEAITPQSLYAHYRRILAEGPIDIFVTGDVQIAGILGEVTSYFKEIEPTRTVYPKTDILSGHRSKAQEITETFDVAQAKLCMGYRTHTAPTDDDYYKLMVYNGILGGGAHSKLFLNVREKLSLAYYAGSRLERFKGILLISAGIEMANKQQAMDEIQLQVAAMRNGEITEAEYSATILSLVNAIRSLGDNINYLEDYYLGQVIGVDQVSLSQFADKVESVTLADVVEIAARVELDTVYFLTGKGQQGGEQA